MAEQESNKLPPRLSLTASRAFRQAALRSEVRRAWAVIGVLVLVSILILWHVSPDLDYHVKVVSVIGVAVLFVVQFGALAFTRWADRRDRAIPDTFTITTVVVESLIPTAMMASHIAHHALLPYASLSSPPVLAYGLLMCLTTLRLRPGLCIMAGFVASASYAVLLLYVIYGMDTTVPTTGLPLAAYINSAMLILISGLAAAWVAREIRGHMEAALGEAETKRQMERIERNLAVARSIQQALLPRSTPNIPGYDIAGWNRPADQTGGDYYDWQSLPDGNWIITLADVSGHGVGPALVMAACRAYVRASGSHHGDLGSLTTRVNRLLADDLPIGRFVTMVSVLIDPRGGPLALLSAGHGPIALYVGKTGVVQDILPGDMPLAIVPDANYGPAQTVVMEPGDVLALVTDGFVEWSRPVIEGDDARSAATDSCRRDPHAADVAQGAAGPRDEFFGIERLRESLRRHASLSSCAIIEAITADVAAFAGATPQQDDLTMVIIRRTG